ncbi:N-formylglutamate amidohydrolase [Pontibacter sp. JH31]|uniref:N-formylglutamate amidohydrolase n=1 Tax=Pontibacter aquaedesilientis TaxID=2766980 RepID=A0ABR7XCS8_9BACT|nr:N-formylglutamate amidohydrolase [Pontibacter aquaedesilientis]MBD1396102.1 N-formylglutamate amidohydrolase [Pontibacter aquaedesilientis]
MLRLLLTCEHGGNKVPVSYEALFKGQEDTLQTHRGYDIGALELFDKMKSVADVHFHSETTRLLVELNRSVGHPKLLSEFSCVLPEKDRERLLQVHYFPYREKVEHMIQDFVSAGRRVLHIAVHSFTPVLDGEERKADIGLLYDPKRKHEQALCRQWKKKLQQNDKDLVIRFNYPYLGIADGLPSYLRRKFTGDQYIGIELEVNQRFPIQESDKWASLQRLLTNTVEELLQENR